MATMMGECLPTSTSQFEYPRARARSTRLLELERGGVTNRALGLSEECVHAASTPGRPAGLLGVHASGFAFKPGWSQSTKP